MLLSIKFCWHLKENSTYCLPYYCEGTFSWYGDTISYWRDTVSFNWEILSLQFWETPRGEFHLVPSMWDVVLLLTELSFGSSRVSPPIHSVRGFFFVCLLGPTLRHSSSPRAPICERHTFFSRIHRERRLPFHVVTFVSSLFSVVFLYA